MKLIIRYISYILYQGSTLVSLVLISLLMLLLLLNELHHLQNHDTFFQALKISFYTLPALIYPLIPMIWVLGTLVGLKRLMQEKIFIILQSSGVSVFKLLSWIGLWFACSLIVILILVNSLASYGSQFLFDHYTQESIHLMKKSQKQFSHWFSWHHGEVIIQHIDQKKSSNQDDKGSMVLYYLDENGQLSKIETVEQVKKVQGQWFFKEGCVDKVKTKLLMSRQCYHQKEAPFWLNEWDGWTTIKKSKSFLSFYELYQKRDYANIKYELLKRCFSPIMYFLMLLVFIFRWLSKPFSREKSPALSIFMLGIITFVLCQYFLDYAYMLGLLSTLMAAIVLPWLLSILCIFLIWILRY